MVKKVVFFNLCHNGDIHISRGLVRKITEVCTGRGIQCEYFHINSHDLLADIPNLKYTANNYGMTDPASPNRIVGDIAFINTWYVGTPGMYDTHGLTFECLYYSFLQNAKMIDIDISQFDVHELFPSIDYTHFKTNTPTEWLQEHNNSKKIFISNGSVLSGQSVNFPFSGIINSLSEENPGIEFLISNDDGDVVRRSNVTFTNQIIQKGGFDLNENAFLADSCDLIVGRMSGAFSFAMNHINYFENNKKFIVITNLPHRYVSWVDIIKPTATFLVYDYDSPEPTLDVIRNNLP